MKFLCVECDRQMAFVEREEPGDGTFGATFRCPRCGRRTALLANPMETQLVGSLGVEIGGRTLDQAPMELTRRSMVGAERALSGPAESVAPDMAAPRWSADATARLARVPGFVRGMVKKIYAEYAAERGIGEITPGVMDRAREELGLEGM
jgi:hypothetical protein